MKIYCINLDYSLKPKWNEICVANCTPEQSERFNDGLIEYSVLDFYF